MAKNKRHSAGTGAAKKAVARKVSLFAAAVDATPDVAGHLKPGLRAFGGYSALIRLGTPGDCTSSVEIDEATREKYPDATRWDYAFDYRNEVFYVEVHSAETGEVSRMLRKLQWLRDWLHAAAPRINALTAKSRPAFYWVQSGRYSILPGSSQERKIIQLGLKPVSAVVLP